MSKEPDRPHDLGADAEAPKTHAERKRRKRQLIGAGIGSAAIVAALLYANRGRRES